MVMYSTVSLYIRAELHKYLAPATCRIAVLVTSLCFNVLYYIILEVWEQEPSAIRECLIVLQSTLLY